MSILRSKYFPFVGLFIALLLPFSLLTISATSSWWTTYLSWVIFFMQSFLMLTAALLTYHAAFHKKVLGGEIGLSLRVFSVGLFLLGCGLTQIPFIDAYNVWQTQYVRGGFYFILYILGGICIIVSLVITNRNLWKRIGSILAVIVLAGLTLRLLLDRVPLHANTFYVTVSSYKLGLTIDTLLLCIVAAVFLLALLHRNLFYNSKIGKVFELQGVGFAWYLIPVVSDLVGDTVPGWGTWYTYSLGGIMLFGGSLLIAAVFFYTMALYVDQIQLS